MRAVLQSRHAGSRSPVRRHRDHLARPRSRAGHARGHSESDRRSGPGRSVRARCRSRPSAGRGGVMGAIWTVFRKEVLENLRDRRVIVSAFFFGVLLAPVIFGLTTTMVSKRAVANQDKPLNLPIAGATHAPNLVHFLRENGVKVEDVGLTSDQAMDAVRSGQQDLVLLIGEDYGKALQAGEPAPLSLFVDTS